MTRWLAAGPGVYCWLDQSLLKQSGDLDTDTAKALLAGLKPGIAAKLVDLVMEKEIFEYAISSPEEG